MFVVMTSVFVFKRLIVVMPTIVFPAPHGSTIVPNPVPGPLSPTIDSAASLWYCLIANGFPESVVSRKFISSGSPSPIGTSSFTGQPICRSSCFMVPLSVSGRLKQNFLSFSVSVVCGFSGSLYSAICRHFFPTLEALISLKTFWLSVTM